MNHSVSVLRRSFKLFHTNNLSRSATSRYFPSVSLLGGHFDASVRSRSSYSNLLASHRISSPDTLTWSMEVICWLLTRVRRNFLTIILFVPSASTTTSVVTSSGSVRTVSKV
ncbi:GSCOCG00003898001-RA-CDS [Cotesia congregata]|nr:GSCOCG00003898001-RA-CDS [Cotesia congregata]